MKLILDDIPKKKLKHGGTVTFRPAPDVALMLDRALATHGVRSKIINACLRAHLTATGYARKREGEAA